MPTIQEKPKKAAPRAKKPVCKPKPCKSEAEAIAFWNRQQKDVDAIAALIKQLKRVL